MAARASRLENQDAIDGAIVAMLSDPKQVPSDNPCVYIMYIYYVLAYQT